MCSMSSNQLWLNNHFVTIQPCKLEYTKRFWGVTRFYFQNVLDLQLQFRYDIQGWLFYPLGRQKFPVYTGGQKD